MLSFEQFRQPQYFQQSFDAETSSIESHSSNNMESYYYNDNLNNNITAYNNNLPFDFSVPEGLEASINSVHEMTRSASNQSMKHVLHEYPPASLSSASIGSASSSTPGSPYSGGVHMFSAQDNYQPQDFMAHPTIVPMFDEPCQQPEYVSGYEWAYHDSDKSTSYGVDPHLLSSQYGNVTPYPHSPYSGYPNSSAPSPAASHGYSPYSHRPSDNHSVQARPEREMSVSSQRSAASFRTSVSGDEENGEKSRCPHPECGKVFKDLKAHMLTHQSKRPEKCPIPTCEWHDKGFSRKYDRNRHVLTHYKGTMVCGFCPGSGSSAENSFNRADVFKRHLTSVHQVEQTAPNSKRRSPNGAARQLSSYCHDATGKCSTCSQTFPNAQEFYEHLDDCVLRMVQQEEPSEAINKLNLGNVAADPAVQEIFERNHIKQEDVPQPFDFNDNGDIDGEEYDDEEEDEYDDEAEQAHERAGNSLTKLPGHRAIIGGNVSKKKSGKKGGMTWSKIGVSLFPKGRKRRQHYPPSWGMNSEKMKMKKRVLCVYDGSHRLLKDDMMLNNEFEVRVRINEGNNYVTDLDVETLKRANAFHEAPEEERKTWFQEQDHEGLLDDLFNA